MDCSCSRKFTSQRRHGFTLVELLVVIGIIALLISILLPSLNRAREEGRRTVCLTGLRSFGQVLNMYASANQGRVPLGYASTKHAGYMVHDSGMTSGFLVLGVLYESGYFKDGASAYYCPSNTDTRWMYNTAENPWPPPSNTYCRLGMTVRPEVEFTGMIPKNPGSTWDSPLFRGKFPVISNMKDKAIAAEMFGEPFNAGVAVDPTVLRHKKNLINVYYADNSAGAITADSIDPSDNKSIMDLLKQLKSMGSTIPSGQTMNDIYLDEINTPNRGMWHKFDIQK